jgi:hypothetical protein
MNSDVAVSIRHYGTQRDGQVKRAASSSSRERILAASLLLGMVLAAVCCVIFLSPSHTTSLESDQDSINDLLSKIDKLTASQQAPASHPAAVLAHHTSHHVRLNVESSEQKFLDEVCFFILLHIACIHSSHVP